MHNVAIASKPTRPMMLGHNCSIVVNREGKMILDEILTKNSDTNIQTPTSFFFSKMDDEMSVELGYGPPQKT